MPTLTLGTRGSQLALFQARAVAQLLQSRAHVECRIVVIKTSGDHLADAALAQIGGKRLFVKEIEEALAAGSVDLAVHSSKDMPALLPPGLILGAVLPREDARDAIVLPNGTDVNLDLEGVTRRLGRNPRIGTSSIRRTAQLIRLLPGASFLPIRGNLDTRLRKLDAGEFDALVLAAAGLRRLNHEARISSALPVAACVPAPGQGIVAVEVRSDDTQTRKLVAQIDDQVAGAALTAERAVVARLGGGCQMPIGAYAQTSAGKLTLDAIVVSTDGQRMVRAAATGSAVDAEKVGRDAAEQLLSRGAAEILAEAGNSLAAVEGLQP